MAIRNQPSFGGPKFAGKFPQIPRREPAVSVLQGTQAQTSGNYGVFFTATDSDYGIVQVYERHEAAGTDAGAVTVDVVVVPSGSAKSAGVSCLAAPISLKATADTNQVPTLASTGAPKGQPTVAWPSALRLPQGASLALKPSGVLTAVSGVCVTVELIPIQPTSIV